MVLFTIELKVFELLDLIIMKLLSMFFSYYSYSEKKTSQSKQRIQCPKCSDWTIFEYNYEIPAWKFYNLIKPISQENLFSISISKMGCIIQKGDIFYPSKMLFILLYWSFLGPQKDEIIYLIINEYTKCQKTHQKKQNNWYAVKHLL